MNIRELIHNLELDNQKLEEENKLLKEENKELKKINQKLVNDWNNKYAPADADKVEPEVEDVLSTIAENVIASAIEPDDEEKRGTPVDEVVEEPKPKKTSRKKKKVETEEVSLI